MGRRPSVSHGADPQYVSSFANEVLTGAVAAKGQERCDRVIIDMLARATWISIGNRVAVRSLVAARPL